MVRRPPRRPGVAGDRHRRALAAGCRALRSGGTAGRRGAQSLRRHVAVPDEGARRRRTAVPAGPSERRAGCRGLRAGGPAGHSGVLADPQLPRPQPQTGAAGGAAHLRGARRIPARREIGGIVAGACGFRPRSVCEPAGRPAGRGRSARAVHDVDHRAATGPRRAGARRDRCRDQLCPVRDEAVRDGGQDRARARGALPRRRRRAGLLAAEPVDPAPRRRDLSARGQSAHVPARCRDRGNGQLRQRPSRRPDPEAR